jgi:hypothetical protein
MTADYQSVQSRKKPINIGQSFSMSDLFVQNSYYQQQVSIKMRRESTKTVNRKCEVMGAHSD